MVQPQEYAVQTVLGAMQVTTVVVGNLFVRAMLSQRVKSGWAVDAWHPEMIFFYRFGFLYLLIPAIWIGGSVWLEIYGQEFSKRWSIITGFLILIGLFGFFVVATGQAASSGMIRQIDD